MIDFCDALDRSLFGSNALIVVIESPRSSADILMQLDSQLQFGDFFGENWNALAEEMRDLSWIKEKQIILYHVHLGGLPAGELRIYLELMMDAYHVQKDNGWHELRLLVDTNTRSSVEAALTV